MIAVFFCFLQNAQDVIDCLEAANGGRQDEVEGAGEGESRQDHVEVSEHQNNGAELVQPPLGHRHGEGADDEGLSGDRPDIISFHVAIGPSSSASPYATAYAAPAGHHHQQQQQQLLQPVDGPTSSTAATTSTAGYDNRSSLEVMLQQYQQQPDYTSYGGIGYNAQPNVGYFNYAATESSWYGSPSPGGEAHHSQQNMVSLVFQFFSNFSIFSSRIINLFLQKIVPKFLKTV